MQLKCGNMWTDSTADFKLFTANATVRKDGALVMGRGCALEAQQLFPGCNKVFGGIIKEYDGNIYGVILHPELPLGAFQVKWHFKDYAQLELIEYSVKMLSSMALAQPDKTFAVNFPGIGYGRLDRSVVLKVIEGLPENVEVWEKP